MLHCQIVRSYNTSELSQHIEGAAKELWGSMTRDPKTDLGLDFEDVEIPVHEGEGVVSILRGWHIPAINLGKKGQSPPPLIICAHGGGRDRRAFLRHSAWIHAGGAGVALG